MTLQTFIMGAIICEALISWGTTIYTEHKLQWEIVASLLIACVLVVDLNLNFFSLIGLTEQYQIIGMVCTAVFLSRGSNYVFELYDRLTNWKREDNGQ